MVCNLESVQIAGYSTVRSLARRSYDLHCVPFSSCSALFTNFHFHYIRLLLAYFKSSLSTDRVSTCRQCRSVSIVAVRTHPSRTIRRCSCLIPFAQCKTFTDLLNFYLLLLFETSERESLFANAVCLIE